MPTSTTRDSAALAPAALVVLVEEFLESGHLRGVAMVLGVIDDLRRTMTLSRSEAQEALRGASDPEAAFVLAYEGVSEYRVDEDYTLTSDDFQAIYRARKRVDLDGRAAVTVLETHARAQRSTAGET